MHTQTEHFFFSLLIPFCVQRNSVRCGVIVVVVVATFFFGIQLEPYGNGAADEEKFISRHIRLFLSWMYERVNQFSSSQPRVQFKLYSLVYVKRLFHCLHFFSVKQKFYWTKNEGIIIFSWLEEASSWEIEPTSKRTNHFFLEYNFLLIWKWTLLQCAVCAFSSQRTQRNCIYSARSENFGNPFQHSLRFLKPQVILNCFYWSTLYENGRASLRTVFSSENLSSVWIVDAVEKYTNARTSNGYLPFFLQTMRACKHCLPQRAKYKIFRAYAAL